MKKIKLLITLMILTFVIVSCGNNNSSTEQSAENQLVEEHDDESVSDMASEMKSTIGDAFSDVTEDIGIGIDDDDDDDDDNISTKSSNDWDKILDDYESLVDSYAKLAKNSKEGDISAISEYPNILEKAQSMSSQLEKSKDELSLKQAARYAKISAKMAKVSLTMM